MQLQRCKKLLMMIWLNWSLIITHLLLRLLLWRVFVMFLMRTLMLSLHPSSLDHWKKYKIFGAIPRKIFSIPNWFKGLKILDKKRLKVFQQKISKNLSYLSLNQISKNKKYLLHLKLLVVFHFGSELSSTLIKLYWLSSQRRNNWQKQNRS